MQVPLLNKNHCSESLVPREGFKLLNSKKINPHGAIKTPHKFVMMMSETAVAYFEEENIMRANFGEIKIVAKI